MSSWLNLSSNISSLTNNISSFTREVLTEAGNESFNEDGEIQTLDQDEGRSIEIMEDATFQMPLPTDVRSKLQALQDEVNILNLELTSRDDQISYLENENHKIKLDASKHVDNLKKHLLLKDKELDENTVKMEELQELFESEKKKFEDEIESLKINSDQETGWNDWNDDIDNSASNADVSKLEVENESLSNEIMMKEIVLNSIESKMKQISKRNIDVADFNTWIDNVLKDQSENEIENVIKESMSIMDNVNELTVSKVKEWVSEMTERNKLAQNKVDTLERTISSIETKINIFENTQDSFKIDNFETWLLSIEERTKNEKSSVDNSDNELIKDIESQIRDFDDEDEDFVIDQFSEWLEKVTSKIDDLSLDVINAQEVKDKEVEQRIEERETLQQLFEEKQQEISMLKVELFNQKSTSIQNQACNDTDRLHHENEELEEKITDLMARCEMLKDELKSSQTVKLEYVNLQSEYSKIEADKVNLVEENKTLVLKIIELENKSKSEGEEVDKDKLTSPNMLKENIDLQLQAEQLKKQLEQISNEAELQSSKDIEKIARNMVNMTELASDLNQSREETGELYTQFNSLQVENQNLKDELKLIKKELKERLLEYGEEREKLSCQNDLLKANESNCLLMILKALNVEVEVEQPIMSLSFAVKELMNRYDEATMQTEEMASKLNASDDNILDQEKHVVSIESILKEISNKISADPLMTDLLQSFNNTEATMDAYSNYISNGMQIYRDVNAGNEDKLKQLEIENSTLAEQLQENEAKFKTLNQTSTDSSLTNQTSTDNGSTNLKFGDLKRRIKELEAIIENLTKENNEFKNGELSERTALDSSDQLSELSYQLDQKNDELNYYSEACASLDSAVTQLQNENNDLKTQYGQLYAAYQQIQAEKITPTGQRPSYDSNQEKLHNLSLMLTEKSEECLRLQQRSDILNAQLVEMQNNTSDMTLIQEECRQLKSMLVKRGQETGVDETITMLQDENKQLKHLLTTQDQDFQTLQKINLEKENEVSDMMLLREECKQLKHMLMEKKAPQDEEMNHLQLKNDHLLVQLNESDAMILELQNETSNMELIQEECRQLKQMLVNKDVSQTNIHAENYTTNLSNSVMSYGADDNSFLLQVKQLEEYIREKDIEVSLKNNELQQKDLIIIALQNSSSDMELLHSECQALKKMISEKEETFIELQSDLDNVNSVMELKNKEMKEIVTARNVLQIELNNANDKVDHMTQEILSLQANLNELKMAKEENDGLKTEYEMMEESLLAAQASLNSMKENLRDAENNQNLLQESQEQMLILKDLLREKEEELLTTSTDNLSLVETNDNILNEYKEQVLELKNKLRKKEEELLKKKVLEHELPNVEHNTIKSLYEEVSELKELINTSSQDNSSNQKNNEHVIINTESSQNEKLLTIVTDIKLLKEQYSANRICEQEQIIEPIITNELFAVSEQPNHSEPPISNEPAVLNKPNDCLYCEQTTTKINTLDQRLSNLLYTFIALQINSETDIVEKVTLLEKSIHNLLQTLDDLGQKLDASETMNYDIEDERKRWKTERDNFSLSIEKLNDQIKSLHSHVTYVNDQNDSSCVEIEKLQEQLKEVLHEKSVIEQNHMQANAQLASQESQYNLTIESLKKDIFQFKEFELISESRSNEIQILKEQLNRMKMEKEEILNNAQTNMSSVVQEECENLRREVDKQSQLYLEKMKYSDQLKIEVLQLEEQNRHYKMQLEKFQESASKLHALEKEVELKNNKIAEMTTYLEDVEVKMESHQKEKLFLDELVQMNEKLKYELEELRHQNHQHVTFIQEKDVILRHKEVTSKEVESRTNRELERLRHHLMTIEENHTQEIIESQSREDQLQEELNEAKDVLSRKSIILQDSSKQFQDHVENIQEQLHILAAERDTLALEISKYKDNINQSDSSVFNLQNALEQLQKDKDEQYEYLTGLAKRKQDELERKLYETGEDHRKMQITMADASLAVQGISKLRLELNQKDHELTLSKEKLHELTSSLQEHQLKWNEMVESSDSKLDKSLIRNLLLRYFQSADDKRADIVQVMGNLIGFTPQEIHEIGNGAAATKVGGWISWGFGSTPSKPSKVKKPTTATKHDVNQSFSELFVKFLEHETENKTNIRSASLAISDDSTAMKTNLLTLQQSTPDIISFHKNKKGGEKFDSRIPAPGQEIAKVHTHHAQTTLKSLLS